MDAFIVEGGNPLRGDVTVSGAKNVAMKVMLSGLLTDQPIFVSNVPLISSVYGTIDIVNKLGVSVSVGKNHTVRIQGNQIADHIVPLELGGLYRTATMVIGPLLARVGEAIVPNPGGCRLGMRPIDRHMEGLTAMGATISYEDGFFHARAKGLTGTRYRFAANTHTGTETLLLAAVLAKGETVLENAAAEPEVDDLIKLLVAMGAKIKRTQERTIRIEGVKKLHGAEFTVMPDRNEAVTFAIAALVTGGDIIINGTQPEYLHEFLAGLDRAGAGWEKVAQGKVRVFAGSGLHATHVTTGPYPGFMTDWQSPWAILMTQAEGVSVLHETIYEDRFGYVEELKKMGARIEYFNPPIKNPQEFYNFNWQDREEHNKHAIRIHGKTQLHNAVLEVADLRAGATLVLAAACASGKSYIRGIDHIDRGYESIEKRLASLGMHIQRVKEE